MVASPIRFQESVKYLSLAYPQMAPDQSMDQRVLYVAMEATQCLGYSTMKPQQLQVVSGIVYGRDVFAVLLTGFGKSLCYACPPTVFGLVLPVEGTSIVLAVVPLTAIRKDQASVVSCRVYLRPQARHNVAQ